MLGYNYGTSVTVLPPSFPLFLSLYLLPSLPPSLPPFSDCSEQYLLFRLDSPPPPATVVLMYEVSRTGRACSHSIPHYMNWFHSIPHCMYVCIYSMCQKVSQFLFVQRKSYFVQFPFMIHSFFVCNVFVRISFISVQICVHFPSVSSVSYISSVFAISLRVVVKK